jgi:adenosylcobinamide-phosphate synthase
VQFLPWQLAAAFGLDLLLGDPRWMPHPTRWIGRLISRVEAIFYDDCGSSAHQRLAGCACWVTVMMGVACGAIFLLKLASFAHPYLGAALAVWLAYTTLALRSLHQESAYVVAALTAGNLALARSRLAMIVSRETGSLEERDILRAVIETVAENFSDGVVAPLFFLALGGPVGGLAYKGVNTMDSMLGYLNDRYRHFGWCAARMDDLANWVPARLSGLLVVAGAAVLRYEWRGAWQIMRRDAGKMKSPNAGYPEAALAGALNIQLGGTSVYFGKPVEKPTLGDPGRPLDLDAYRAAVRLLYVSSLAALGLALGLVVVAAMV